MSFFEELYFDYKVKNEKQANRLSLFVHPKQSIRLTKVVVEYPFTFSATDKLFCNGFQSWSESKMYNIDQTIPRLRKIAKPFFQFYGDEHMFPTAAPKLYSWTYGFINSSNQYHLFGSTQENTSFTLIEYDVDANVVRMTKLCDDIELSHSFPVFDLYIQQGNEKEVFDGYFHAIGPSPKTLKPSFGWTSWYRHYNNISEEIILKDLKAFAEISDDSSFNDTKRIFQIDDGYQSEIGDWLSVSKDFPNGMAKIASQVSSYGLTPGIWIAPFVCSKYSKIFANHQDWLLKNSKGAPLRVGNNPLWGGWYYALDFYNKQVKDYLTEVFYTLLNKWGYQLIKADFLFAACVAPPANKTKGQVMYEAMQFLNQLIGENKLLACGVPLGSTFNLCDYCRIGPDIHLAWEHSLLRFIRKRERVSTISALRTIIHRRHLNGSVFLSDPDVYIMREKGHKYSPTQQYTIMLIQVLFGSQIFNSDDWQEYSFDTIEEIKSLLAYRNAEIINCLEVNPDFFQIIFNQSAKFTAWINLNNSKVNIPGIKPSYKLLPFESIVLKNNSQQV